MAQQKTDRRPRQRRARHQLGDVPHLRRRRLEELAPRWRVGEQVHDLDARTGCGTGGAHLFDLAAARQHLCAAQIARAAGDERRGRHSGDAGQGLATKPESGDVKEIVHARDFTGGVAREGAHGIVGVRALAVVGDGDEPDAGIFQLDANVAGAGVERVLDQLLDHRGRPLHDFARRDLVGDLRRQHPYAAGRFCGSGHTRQST